MTTINVTRPPGYSALRQHSGPPAANYEFSAPLGPGAARVLTDQIKVGVEAVWELVKQAYIERAWSALGYATWDDYCTSEFGASRLRLPREERAEVVASLQESGLSIRAIASATGLGRGTVARELAAVPNGTPDAEPIESEVVEEQVVVDHTDVPDNVIGLDGKRYRREHPTGQSQPRRRPITEAFRRVTYEIDKRTSSLARLVTDDRFARNKAEIRAHHLADLIRIRDEINDAIEQLGNLDGS